MEAFANFRIDPWYSLIYHINHKFFNQQIYGTVNSIKNFNHEICINDRNRCNIDTPNSILLKTCD